MNTDLRHENEEYIAKAKQPDYLDDIVSKEEYENLESKYKDLELRCEELELQLKEYSDENRSDGNLKDKDLANDNQIIQPDFDTFKK